MKLKVMKSTDAKIVNANVAITQKQASYDAASERLHTSQQALQADEERRPKRPRTERGASGDAERRQRLAGQVDLDMQRVETARKGLTSTVEKHAYLDAARSSGKVALKHPNIEE
jgi:hypothetical protein